MNISDERLQGYLDGFKAATDIAASVQLKVSPEVDPGIDLGVRTVESTLRRQYDTFLRGGQ